MFVWNEPLICGGVTRAVAELDEEGFNGFNGLSGFRGFRGFTGLIPGTGSDWFGRAELVEPDEPAVVPAAGGVEDVGPCPRAEVDDPPEVDGPWEVDDPAEEVDDPPEVDGPDELDSSAYAGICPVLAAPTPTKSSTVATRPMSLGYAIEATATSFRTRPTRSDWSR